jgi:hypothetical protein
MATASLRNHADVIVCDDVYVEELDARHPLLKLYGSNFGAYPEKLDENVERAVRAGAALALCKLGESEERSANVSADKKQRAAKISAVIELEFSAEELERAMPAALVRALQDAQFALAAHVGEFLSSGEAGQRVASVAAQNKRARN